MIVTNVAVMREEIAAKRPETWREHLHEVIFEADTPAGKTFDVLLLVAIVVSVLVVTLDSVEDFRAHHRTLLGVLEWALTIGFTIEYVLRVICVRSPLRYVFSLSFVAVREVEWHLYALIFLLGAAYTLKHDAHVRVDVIFQYFGPRTRALVNVLGTLLFLLPGCWLLIKTSINFVQYAYMIGEVSPDPGGLPLRWLIKAAIPFGFGLVALQGVAFLIRNLLILITPPSATKRPE